MSTCNLAEHTHCESSITQGCAGSIQHWQLKNGPGCVAFCTAHSRLYGYVTSSLWEEIPLPGATTAQSLQPVGSEPACSCPMFVGACVSIGHRADCAWQKWNTARHAPKSAAKAATNAGCKHVFVRFSYGSQASPDLLGRSGGAVCKHCMQIQCHDARTGVGCSPGEHGPSVSSRVVCGKKSPFTDLILESE